MKLYMANLAVPARRVIRVSGSPTLKKAPKTERRAGGARLLGHDEVGN